jgi:ubiquinone/menaquinone biosynthesis C-methylase UbiE
MDAEHMAFPDATFDKAVVLFAMAGLPDPVRAMQEIERVCPPGATIVIANHFLIAALAAAYMRKLYGLGYELAVKGIQWATVPPAELEPTVAADK